MDWTPVTPSINQSISDCSVDHRTSCVVAHTAGCGGDIEKQAVNARKLRHGDRIAAIGSNGPGLGLCQRLYRSIMISGLRSGTEAETVHLNVCDRLQYDE